MLLSKLNQDQRKSFLALLTKMALADGQVVPHEVALLERLTETYGGPDPVPADEIYGTVNVEVFHDRESRIVTLTSMIVVALVDDHLHLNESSVIDDTAAAFGFAAEELDAMKQWARSQANLILEFQNMV